MSEVSFISTSRDAAAADLSSWAGALQSTMATQGHDLSVCAANGAPDDRANCELLLKGPARLVFFFGHGTTDELRGAADEPLVDRQNLRLARGKVLVSVACESGLELGPTAVISGLRAHLGWDVMLLWLSGEDADRYGRAIYGPLGRFGHSASVSEVKRWLEQELNRVAQHHRRNRARNPNAKLAYYAAAAAAGQISVHGDGGVRPMATGPTQRLLGWIRWRLRFAFNGSA